MTQNSGLTTLDGARFRHLVAWSLAGIVSVGCGGGARSGSRELAERTEAAYRANNRGVALLEQFAHEEAAGAFREALDLDPSLGLARINLPIALFYAGRNEEAAERALAARDSHPDAPQPAYLLGLIARAGNEPDEAVAAFRRVLEIDAEDVGAMVNLALVYVQQRQYVEAVALCEAALAIEPFNATAAYNLAVALTRSGAREAGERAMVRFQELRDVPWAVTYSQAYLEQGRYAEGVVSTGAEPDLVSLDPPAVAFADATSSLVPRGAESPAGAASAAPLMLAGSVTLADLDQDGDLDGVATGPAVRVLRNDREVLIDVTAEWGLGGVAGATTGAVAGDFDNDSRPDLLLLVSDGLRLFAQRAAGAFEEVRDPAIAAAAGGPVRAAAFVDVDHDGDLDIFAGGLTRDRPQASGGWAALGALSGAASHLLRNNGNRTFTDITTPAGLSGETMVVAIGPTDFDNRRDVDLLMVPYGARPKLFRNRRTGEFADAADTAGLPDAGAYTSLALGDVNKDGFTDLFLGREGAPGLWAMSDGQERFRVTEGPPRSANTTAAQLVDYDNDGLIDLVTLTTGGPRLFRNLGARFEDHTDRAFPADLDSQGSLVALAAGDLDLDGDSDLVVLDSSGALRVWRNDGGNRHPSVRVRLAGLVSNRGGVGAKIEMRAGSLHQKAETASATPAVAPADIVFGLGGRGTADVVRVLWPSGVLQAETAPMVTSATSLGMTIAELNRKPSSCPYLFTWNGAEFEFVTDFMGGGEMGYWEAPGVRNVPDPEEYVRISDSQLQARDGRLDIRVTNELEEVLFVDRLRLLAVTHPSDVTIFPDEGLRTTRRPFRLYAARGARAPAAAVDGLGRDVLSAVARLDRRYPDGFDLMAIRGYAGDHSLTLDLGPRSAGSPADREVLLLTGWTDYAFSSDNVAAHQAGFSLTPPGLQVRDEAGRWRTVDADLGVPIGRPQTLVVDLSRLPLRDRTVRIVTNMRVYWDQILVAAALPSPSLVVDPVPRLDAELRWRGFSAEVAPDGREPFGYDYERVRREAPWKLPAGRYTREGDVSELVDEADDRFVVSRSGDELALSFDARALPPLPSGMRRTYLLHTIGYSKEMDFHSASPDRVAPLPFGAMSGYPYGLPERYPREADLDRFHTRVVPRSIPLLAP